MRQDLQEVQEGEGAFLYSSQNAPKIREDCDHSNDSLTYPSGKTGNYYMISSF